jgi:hypothetical protein
VYPYFVLYGATLMTETFFIVALLWVLERTVALAGSLRPGGAVAILTLCVRFVHTVLPDVVACDCRGTGIVPERCGR